MQFIDDLSVSVTLCPVLLGGTMLKQLRRAKTFAKSEVSAWCGTCENLELHVISYEKPKTLRVHLGKSVGVTHLLPNGISDRLMDALHTGRNISTIFLRDPQTAEGAAYVIAIDLDCGRVDRELSSWQLLEDPWSWNHELAVVEKDTSAERERLTLGHYFFGLALIFLSPVQRSYQDAFLAQQKKKESERHFSRRFESLVECLAPQLEKETSVVFECALKKLWYFEHWASTPEFMSAHQKFSEAHLTVTLVDHDPDDGDLYDFGPRVQFLVWKNAKGKEIASGLVRCHDDNPHVTSTGILSGNGWFYHEDAERLLQCFQKKTVLDKRKKK